MKRGVKVTVIATYNRYYGKQGVVIGGVADKYGIEYLVGLASGETISVQAHEIAYTTGKGIR
jgi:hypothetical protein